MQKTFKFCSELISSYNWNREQYPGCRYGWLQVCKQCPSSALPGLAPFSVNTSLHANKMMPVGSYITSYPLSSSKQKIGSLFLIVLRKSLCDLFVLKLTTLLAPRMSKHQWGQVKCFLCWADMFSDEELWSILTPVTLWMHFFPSLTCFSSYMDLLMLMVHYSGLHDDPPAPKMQGTSRLREAERKIRRNILFWKPTFQHRSLPHVVLQSK